VLASTVDDAISGTIKLLRPAHNPSARSHVHLEPNVVCLNFLIHIDLDMDANPFPLKDRPVIP
jgi:hypothetical protein